MWLLMLLRFAADAVGDGVVVVVDGGGGVGVVAANIAVRVGDVSSDAEILAVVLAGVCWCGWRCCGCRCCWC